MRGARSLSRGDVVLVLFPFTDLSSQKLRPAVIVGRVRGEDVIVAFVTSQSGEADPGAEHLLELSDPEFDMTGLKAASLVRLDRIATLHRRLIQRRIGRVGTLTEQALGRALRYVFQL